MAKNEETKWISIELPVDLASKVEELKDGTIQQALLLSYLDDCKKELRDSIENMDEDVLIFKGTMAKAKQGFKDARDEYLDSSYKIWEDSDEKLPQLTKKTEKLVSQLRPLTEELDKINATIKQIDTFDMQRLIEFIRFFNANVYGETENILKHLMDNYKKQG